MFIEGQTSSIGTSVICSTSRWSALDDPNHADSCFEKDQKEAGRETVLKIDMQRKKYSRHEPEQL